MVFLSLYGTVMTLPFIGMFYGLHEWTGAHLRVRRPHHRPRRHHGGLAARPGGHDPDAGLDRPGGARGAEGHLFRGHGRLHQPGAFGRQPRHQLPEPALHRSSAAAMTSWGC
ncbi:MAG: hypothetical protein M0C28_46915 [Candidatus Moduliflexus flocculans]|nr:hypothetical protein [Candidatus Moduliflexus flocculans]